MHWVSVAERRRQSARHDRIVYDDADGSGGTLQPEVFGESARPMLESARNGETEIWRLVGTVLTPEQQAELRRSIDLWHSQNPLPESVLAVSSLGIASQLAEASKDNAVEPGSVFSLLKVDPLSGLDPAVREIAQTRMFASAPSSSPKRCRCCCAGR